MKISKLAAFRENLQGLKLQQSLLSARAEMDRVIFAAIDKDNQMPGILENLKHHRDSALASLQSFDLEIDNLLSRVIEQIQALEPAYLARSYQLYEEGLCYDTVDSILNRRFPIDDQSKTYIQSRIQSYSAWQYAGMILRPGLEDWIEHMVACDPLYLVDTAQELFSRVREKFNPMYQNRLRYYAIREGVDQPMMSALSDGQFGLILAYNFFHYKPFEIMRQYLEELYAKLRPGGVLCMTFNDCDRRGAVELAERMNNCYTPGRLVMSICQAAGFEIHQNMHLDAAVNWVELKKPGQIMSLRGGQTLAKIVAKSK